MNERDLSSLLFKRKENVVKDMSSVLYVYMREREGGGREGGREGGSEGGRERVQVCTW